ncbi:hypothetical protein GFL80_24770 [Rhizobium leguminosarum bv. viciae]|nr:hypothetical protein [Rhizobium leguminosarum bv. viciae]NKK92901.1 hypothetical protein [Rhizobium leguminosarum bv. viciae]
MDRSSLSAISARLVQPSRHTISGVIPNGSIAMDRSAADMLSEVCIEILPPDRDETCAGDTTTCPCCRRLRPASSMDDDRCGICDECLAP